MSDWLRHGSTRQGLQTSTADKDCRSVLSSACRTPDADSDPRKRTPGQIRDGRTFPDDGNFLWFGGREWGNKHKSDYKNTYCASKQTSSEGKHSVIGLGSTKKKELRGIGMGVRGFRSIEWELGEIIDMIFILVPGVSMALFSRRVVFIQCALFTRGLDFS